MKTVKYSDNPVLWHINLIITNPFIWWAVLFVASFVFQFKFNYVSDHISSAIGENSPFYFYSSLFQGNAAIIAIISAVLIFKKQEPENKKTIDGVTIKSIDPLTTLVFVMAGSIVMLPLSHIVHKYAFIEIILFLIFIRAELSGLFRLDEFLRTAFYRIN